MVVFFWQVKFFTFVTLENHVHDFDKTCNYSDHAHLNSVYQFVSTFEVVQLFFQVSFLKFGLLFLQN
jgi:hypothetical protein